MLADGIVSFCEGFEALAVHDAPYATVDVYIYQILVTNITEGGCVHQSIECTGYDQRAIPVKVHCGDIIQMCI